MCTVLLQPAGYPIAVRKYIIISYRIIYHIIYRITYHIICRPREHSTGLGPRSRKRGSFCSCCMDVLGYIVEESRILCRGGRSPRSSEFDTIPPSGRVKRQDRFLGAFAKLRKKLLASSCLSVPRCSWSSSLSTERIFMRICCLSISRKSVEKIQISLKYENNNGHLTRRPTYFCDNISLNSS